MNVKKKRPLKRSLFPVNSCVESEQGNGFVVHSIDVIDAAGCD